MTKQSASPDDISMLRSAMPGEGRVSAVPDFKPKIADMNAHIHALFPLHFVHHFPDAKIEIAWSNATGAVSKAKLFSAFNPAAISAFAAERNARESNVYIGPTLRRGDTPTDRRSSDEHALASSVGWIDLDDAGAFDAALAVAEAKGSIPSIIVLTGSTPHRRGHLYFGITGGVSDLARLRAINTSLQKCFGGDPAVANPGRIMRLAGTVSYPSAGKLARGYVAELVRLL